VAMAQVIGPRAAVSAALDHGELDPATERLGPLPFRAARLGPDAAEPLVQVLLRTPLEHGPQLAASLAAMRAGRSARKEKDSVAVRMDPVEAAG